ncbi:Ku protein [Microbaculum marinum]|uniref:Non-homologous end joining protein Ku n=1 Tax=Microbaculum marinum TaxID=1764581 RepID=A0AAW9RZG3_9HYPH
MAARALWKGQLRLSLVSIPVELYSATRSGASISFRQIHEPSGKPVHYQKVVDGIGPIDSADIMKGFEFEKDNYVLLDPDEVDAIKLETKKTLELVQFVGACEIPPLYFDKPYYLVPTDELAMDAYSVVRDALRETEKIGLGQLALRGKEYLAAIKPCGNGLLLETLHYEDEIRKADPLFSEISDDKADKDLLEVATTLIERKSAPFDASAFKDHYTDALRALVDRKRGNKKAKRVAAEDTGRAGDDNVVDLMSALKKSLEGTKASGKGSSKTKSSSKSTSGSSSSKSRSRGSKKAA